MVVKEELQEMVEYIFDPVLDINLKSGFVFSYLPLRISWTISSAFLGGWIQAGPGKKRTKTNSSKFLQAVA